MNGNGVIVMRLTNGVSDNGHRYYEHASLQGAKGEAHRLAQNVGGKFVVYVPVAIIEPAPRTVETTVNTYQPDLARVAPPLDEVEYPF